MTHSFVLLLYMIVIASFVSLVFQWIAESGFSQMHKIGNTAIIANFVFLYNCSFLVYLQQLID